MAREVGIRVEHLELEEGEEENEAAGTDLLAPVSTIIAPRRVFTDLTARYP